MDIWTALFEVRDFPTAVDPYFPDKNAFVRVCAQSCSKSGFIELVVAFLGETYELDVVSIDEFDSSRFEKDFIGESESFSDKALESTSGAREDIIVGTFHSFPSDA